MTHKTVPPVYVGVTGIACMADVELCRELAAAMPPGTLLMAGVLSSRKILFDGIVPLRPRYPDESTARELLSALMDTQAFAVMHYNTRANNAALRCELDSLSDRFPMMHGIQLNVVSPAPSALRGFWEETNVAPILQMNRASLPPWEGDEFVNAFVHRVVEYAGMIPYALLDPSMGTGVPLDLDTTRGIVARRDEIESLGIRIGVSGGLNAWTVRKLAGMPVSVDAESGLRDEHDDLNHLAVRGYVQAALETLELSTPQLASPMERAAFPFATVASRGEKL